MNFATWSIKKPVPVLMLFFLLTVLGLYSFKQITVQDFPDIEFPAVTVSVSLPGLSPAQMEIEVTRKLEDSMATLDQLENIQSTVNEGVSSTTITFKLEKDLSEAVNEVRDSVSKIRNQLPADMNEPLINKITTSGGAFVSYAVGHPTMSETELSWFVDNDISKTLLAVEGVSKVIRQGGQEREIHIEMNPALMQTAGISLISLTQQLKASQTDTYAGLITEGNKQQAIKLANRSQSLEVLKTLPIALPDGRKIVLQDIATIKDTQATQNQGALLNGNPVVGFQVFRAKGTGELDVHAKVVKALESLKNQTPALTIQEVHTTVPRVQKGFDSSMFALYEGSLLAVLVIFAFLRNWRATFIAAVALPLSIIPTFGVMQLMGFSLNTVTFLALTLVVGVLVDDAIVEVENIVRHIREGKDPLTGAIEAVNEIGLAVIATSFTLIAVFLPTAFMGGVPGKFFMQFGWTAAIAVFMSLLVARLITPMMGAYLLKHEEHSHEPSKHSKTYLRAVTACLDNPKKTLAASCAFLMLSLIGIAQIPTTFMPAEDRGQITIALEFEPGSKYSTIENKIKVIHADLKKLDSIATVFTTIGSGGSGGSRGSAGSNAVASNATVQITLVKERAVSQSLVEDQVREILTTVPGIRSSFGMGASGEKLSIVLASDNKNKLLQTAQQIETELRAIPQLGNISASTSLSKQELVITPDEQKMAEAGVSPQTVGTILKLATEGDFNASSNKYNLPDRQIPVKVKLPESFRNDLNQIKQLKIPTTNGHVPLHAIASFQQREAPAQITRRDRQEIITLNADLRGMPLGEAYAQVSKLPSMKNLPPEVTRKSSGDLERMQELFGSFGLAMGIGVFCIYTVLVILFHSFIHPITILAALPLSAGGAFGLMYLAGFSFSMPALIGLLMLMGIVTKNSILLVEYAITAMDKQQASVKEAMLDACSKRAQPIIMTTIAMIAGMLPLALGLEGNKSFAMPMATAVIGGLITSTILSLFVVPVIFELMDNTKQRVLRLNRQLQGRSSLPENPQANQSV